MIRAALLDIDGTLIDSNDAHARAWVDACRAISVTVDFNRVRRLIGMGADHIVPVLIEAKADSSEGRKLAAHQRRLFTRNYLQGLRPFPGARELVLRMKSEGLKIAIATSSDADLLTEILKRLRIAEFIEATVTKSDAEHSKPSPDIVTAALGKLGVTGDEAVFLGDTPYDIEAARRAGVVTVALLCGGWADDALKDAVAIYRDPLDLLRGFANSIFSRHRRLSGDIPFPLG